MADEKREQDQGLDAVDKRLREEAAEGGENSEWVRDQVGEDHNLSGSDTYRTLPDQPGDEQQGDTSKNVDNDRQSNR